MISLLYYQMSSLLSIDNRGKGQAFKAARRAYLLFLWPLKLYIPGQWCKMVTQFVPQFKTVLQTLLGCYLPRSELPGLFETILSCRLLSRDYAAFFRNSVIYKFFVCHDKCDLFNAIFTISRPVRFSVFFFQILLA